MTLKSLRKLLVGLGFTGGISLIIACFLSLFPLSYLLIGGLLWGGSCIELIHLIQQDKIEQANLMRENFNSTRNQVERAREEMKQNREKDGELSSSQTITERSEIDLNLPNNIVTNPREL